MTQRKGIQIEKETYAELKQRRQYDGEPLTKVVERLLDTYSELI